MRVLYLSYDGALDPLGASQVLPYLEALARRGCRHTLMSFEKPARWADRDLRRRTTDRLRAAGVEWHPLPYHRRPTGLSTAFDLARGVRWALRLTGGAATFDLVHVRSYPCAVIAHRLLTARGLPYLFDLRGFYPEERVEGGLWRAGGTLYRVTKRLEARFLRDAAAVVTLTDASVPALSERMRAVGAEAEVHVIPTAVDLTRFPLAPVPPEPHLMYLGSIGTWYLLPEMAGVAKTFLRRKPEGRVTFLTNGEHDLVRAAMAEGGVDDRVDVRVDVRAVSHDRVPGELATATATFALIRPGGSKIASAPTKFAESLAVGAPVLVNPGVGDVAAVAGREQVGVALDPQRSQDYPRAVDALVALAHEPGIRERCRDVAKRHFDLERAADHYRSAYDAMLGRVAGGRRA